MCSIDSSRYGTGLPSGSSENSGSLIALSTARQLVAHDARYGAHGFAVSASWPYTSVPPLTGSPASSDVRSPADTVPVGASSPPASVVSGSSPPDPPSDPVVVAVSSAAVVAAESADVDVVASSSSPHAATTINVMEQSAAMSRPLRFDRCTNLSPFTMTDGAVRWELGRAEVSRTAYPDHALRASAS